MRRETFTAFFFLLLFSSSGFGQTKSGTAIHDNPLGPRLIDGPIVTGITGVAWQFPKDGVIRSSAAVAGNSVVFGNGAGKLFCLDKATARARWVLEADGPIHSSPCVQAGKIYFTTQKNSLYAVSLDQGRLLWKVSLGKPLPYDWGFNYYTSTPLVVGDQVFVGSADGNLYALQTSAGQVRWKFPTDSRILSSPAWAYGNVYFGDASGRVYAANATTGKKQWEFKTKGADFRNEDFGFDRRAILAAPTIRDSTLLIGGRDGFLYALDPQTGKQRWLFDYQVSWIISTVACRDGLVVTGTSDGRFVHALQISTGKEVWRYKTSGIVWASPVIVGQTVLVNSVDGECYALALTTGKRI